VLKEEKLDEIYIRTEHLPLQLLDALHRRPGFEISGLLYSAPKYELQKCATTGGVSGIYCDLGGTFL
jgi:hypothetical protein